MRLVNSVLFNLRVVAMVADKLRRQWSWRVSQRIRSKLISSYNLTDGQNTENSARKSATLPKFYVKLVPWDIPRTGQSGF